MLRSYMKGLCSRRRVLQQQSETVEWGSRWLQQGELPLLQCEGLAEPRRTPWRPFATVSTVDRAGTTLVPLWGDAQVILQIRGDRQQIAADYNLHHSLVIGSSRVEASISGTQAR